ncbi:MAG TPA: exosortase-associated EpsI family protein [Terriglobales bacterium]|nr:exosortase-associated EpsI family protein [Terriglobales bacterium]
MQDFRRNLVVILACLMVAIAIEAGLPAVPPSHLLPADASLASLPYEIGPFIGREAHGPEVGGFPGELHRIYQAQGNPVELLAFPAAVNEHGPENCLPYLGWSIIARQRRTLQANPAIELQTVIAISSNPAQRPLACGYYWRRNNAAAGSLLASWLQQRWATVTQSLQGAELVTVCTPASDIRRPQPALQRVYEFANSLEPYFQSDPPRVLLSRARRPLAR